MSKRPNPCTLTPSFTEPLTFTAEWPMRRLRFLLSDGRTADVLSSRDDSDLRGALLAATGVERIEGVVWLDP